MVIEPPGPALRLKVNHFALTENWRTLDRLSGPARAGAAIKADAYGLGALTVAQSLRDAGCADFFVAHWGEAASLREVLSPQSMSVLHGPMHSAEVDFAKASKIKPVINSLDQAERWLAGGGGICDLMVDTGINRLGLPLSSLADPLIARLDVDLLMSHLASADEDSPLNALQRARWDAARAQLSHRRASLANSAGIMLGHAYHGDLTRPGLSLYGGIPCSGLSGAILPVVQPEAALVQVRDIAEGDTVGYNATFTAPKAMRIGVVSLGYADGYLRCWSDKGVFRSGDALLPVLGRVSMDMTVISLDAAPTLREGDWVSADYSLPEAAATSGLSQYELLTLLGMRFIR